MQEIVEALHISPEGLDDKNSIMYVVKKLLSARRSALSFVEAAPPLPQANRLVWF